MINKSGFYESCRYLDKLFSKYLILKINEPKDESHELENKAITKIRELLVEEEPIETTSFKLNRCIQSIVVYNEVYKNLHTFYNSKKEDADIINSYQRTVRKYLTLLAQEFGRDNNYDYFPLAEEHYMKLQNDLESKLSILHAKQYLNLYNTFRSIVLNSYKFLKSNKLSLQKEVYKDINRKYVKLLKSLDNDILAFKHKMLNYKDISVDYDTDKYLGAGGNVITVKDAEELNKALSLEMNYCIRKCALKKYYA